VADFGSLPSMSLADIQALIEQACRAMPNTWMAERLAVRLDVGLPNDAYLTAADEPVVTDLHTATERYGRPCGRVGGWRVSCDARLYQS